MKYQPDVLLTKVFLKHWGHGHTSLLVMAVRTDMLLFSFFFKDFQDFHTLRKENEVSLVRTFLSAPGSESKIGRLGSWGWQNDTETLKKKRNRIPFQIGTGKGGHYEKGLFTAGISRISRFSRISRKWSESPLFYRVWGLSRISRIPTFSRISKKKVFLKRPLFQKIPFSEPDQSISRWFSTAGTLSFFGRILFMEQPDLFMRSLGTTEDTSHLNSLHEDSSPKRARIQLMLPNPAGVELSKNSRKLWLFPGFFQGFPRKFREILLSGLLKRWFWEKSPDNDDNGGCHSSKTTVYRERGFNNPDFGCCQRTIARKTPVISTRQCSCQKLATFEFSDLQPRQCKPAPNLGSNLPQTLSPPSVRLFCERHRCSLLESVALPVHGTTALQTSRTTWLSVQNTDIRTGLGIRQGGFRVTGFATTRLTVCFFPLQNAICRALRNTRGATLTWFLADTEREMELDKGNAQTEVRFRKPPLQYHLFGFLNCSCGMAIFRSTSIVPKLGALQKARLRKVHFSGDFLGVFHFLRISCSVGVPQENL